jgi:DNA-directed RNA polymerase specialized sigma24 family protein
VITDLPVAHGWTMRSLDQVTRAAVNNDRSRASDADTRYNTAWSAIAEHLCAADEPPTWHDLFTVGWRAIYAEVREMREVFGFKDRDGTTETASAPRYVAYWWQPPHRPEDSLLERIAVYEILATLPEIDREAIVALAVHGDYQAAADSIGLKYTALTARLTVARKRFRAQWFAPETAPRIKGTDRRVGSRNKPLATHCKDGKGPHEMTPENTYRRPNPKPGKRGERVCRACEAERGKARVAARQAAA